MRRPGRVTHVCGFPPRRIGWTRTRLIDSMRSPIEVAISGAREMQLHLILPGLAWPNAGASGLASGLNLPALETMLACARVAHEPPMSFESWLGQAFGIPPDRVPVAALRRLGERDNTSVEGEWLCADPVHLHFAGEHLLLTDGFDLGLSTADAATLLEGLNDHFLATEPDFIRFEARSSRRWYLRLKSPARAEFSPLGEVVGRPVARFMPRGEESSRWQRIINESQVFLHNHPVNQAREAAGQRMVNSLWFWGGGSLPEKVVAPAPIVRAEDRLTCGLARAAGVRPDGLTGRLPAQDAFIVVDALYRPSLHLDIDAWRSAMVELETQWFKPLLAALKSRKLTRLRITAPGDRVTLEMRLGAYDLWKFWSRPRSLESLVSSVP